MFQKTLDEGVAGDNVGVLLRGIEKNDLERGQVVCKPGSITPHTKFEAEVYVLSKDEGGRHTPFFKGYRPQFYFRTTDVTGSILNLLSEDGSEAEMCMPGDNIKMTVELDTPIAMEDEPPLRHPRRRQDGRRRRRDQDPRMTKLRPRNVVGFARRAAARFASGFDPRGDALDVRDPENFSKRRADGRPRAVGVSFVFAISEDRRPRRSGTSGRRRPSLIGPTVVSASAAVAPEPRYNCNA